MHTRPGSIRETASMWNYEVISTDYEAENLIHNYCFTEDSLIRSGMPRYDFIDADRQPKRRILFAPSWRNYLIGSPDSNGNRADVPEKFLHSKFYQETQSLLKSQKLHDLLEKHDYYLDFKLHPIFSAYESLYSVESDRIHIGKSLEEADYCCCISDFSSYTFDFVYLKRPIFYFFPDYELFRAGMFSYRELDLPLENGFGPLAETADEMIRELAQLLENNCIPDTKFSKKEADFFYHYDNACRDRIYEQLIQGSRMC